MPTIDDTRGVLVVRIVYDGPAMSGKTTSLRALAQGVSRNVECPAERDGRTLFFDWVDYVGGLFEGRQIRCQIISVPGQQELFERRKLLLESADAVVVVLDTRRQEWGFGVAWLAETGSHCRVKDPPVGLVLQANKRDAADAVTTEALRESLRRITPVAVVESTATAGDGIREAFVFAVRLALDRVRALSAGGRLLVGPPQDDNPQQLFERMRALDEAPTPAANTVDVAGDSVAEDALHHELSHWIAEAPPLEPSSASEADASPFEEQIFVPDPMIPGGMIWPPVDGRALLHDIASLGVAPSPSTRGDWCGVGSGVRFHSARLAIFADHRVARNELIEWARLHAANALYLSPGRAVILADAGHGRLRLWQIVRADATLRERLASALVLTDPAAMAKELLGVVSQLASSREAFKSASVALPCTLWTTGAGGGYRPVFVGLMPLRDNQFSAEPQGPELIERELAPHLRELRRTRVDYGDVAARVVRLAEAARPHGPERWLAELFTAL